MLGSPTMYIALLNHPDLDNMIYLVLKSVISGSAPLPVEVIKAIRKKNRSSYF